MLYNSVCGKRCPIYIYNVRKKKTCLGCFGIEKICDKDNATGLKKGGGIEMSTTVLPFTITIITL